MVSGATADWGSMPRVRATAFAGVEWMARPSSNTRPACGRRMRASARSRVDLPQAFGPTITLNRPSGTARSRPATTTRSS